jgi:hypothetical protein
VFNLDKRRRWRLEIGYMNQWYWRSAETQEGLKRINHRPRVTMALDAPFRIRSRQKPASFSLDEVMTKVSTAHAGKN